MMIEQELSDAFRRQLSAMRNGDAATLAGLLDDGFTLTHMTGYRQPADEWLRQMTDGLFVYHRLEERSLVANAREMTLQARLVADATVYGMRATWRLQLVQKYRQGIKGVIAASSVASTW